MENLLNRFCLARSGITIIVQRVVSKVQTSRGWNSTPAPTKQASFKLLSSLFYRPINDILDYSESRIHPQEVWTRKYVKRAQLQILWWYPIQTFVKCRKITKNLEIVFEYAALQTTTCIYSLFNRWGGPFYVAEEACKVCFSIIPMIIPYLRETLIF